MKTLLIAAIVVAMAVPVTGVLAATPAGSAPVASAPAAARKARFEPITGRSTLSSVQKSRVLRVCVAINAPWVMHDKSGKLIGYSVDVASQFAADMGWKAQFVETGWPSLLVGLRTNQCDIAISGVSITPQRAMQVSFTQPYGQYGIGVVANRKQFAHGDTAAFEAASAGKQVAVRKGTIDVAVARRVMPQAQLVEVTDEQQAIDGVRDGKYAAYVAEAPRPALLAKIYPDALRVLSGDPLGSTAHGMALRIGETRMLGVANAWITSEQASGWLKARAKYWFKGTAWASEL